MRWEVSDDEEEATDGLIDQNRISDSPTGIFVTTSTNGLLFFKNTVSGSGNDCNPPPGPFGVTPLADYVLEPTVFDNTLFVSKAATVCDDSGGANKIHFVGPPSR